MEKGLNAAVMSFDNLPFNKESFDAVCLLHVPNSYLSDVLMGIREVLNKEGLFYMGVYGGIDQEGI